MGVSRGRVTIALVLCLCLGIALAGASPAPSESTLLLERTASTDSLEDTGPRGRASSPPPRSPPPRPTPAVRHAAHVAQRAQAKVVRAQVKAQIAVARISNAVAALRSAAAHARGPAAVKLQKKLARAEHKLQRRTAVNALVNQKAQAKLRLANLKLQTKQLKLQLRSGAISKQQRDVLKARLRILKKGKRAARRAARKAARKLRKQRRRASRHKNKRWRRKLRHLKRKLRRSSPAKRARIQARIRALKIKRKAAKAKKRANRGRKLRKAARKQKKFARRLGKLYGKLRNASKKAARAIRKQIRRMKKKFRKASRKALRRRHRKHRRHGRKVRRHGRKHRRHGRRHGRRVKKLRRKQKKFARKLRRLAKKLKNASKRAAKKIQRKMRKLNKKLRKIARKARKHKRRGGKKVRRHRRRHGRKHGRKGRRHGRRVKKLRRKQKKFARKLRRLAKKLKNASKRAAKKIQRKMRKLNKKLRKIARKARKHKRRGGKKVRRHGRRHGRRHRRQHRLRKKLRKVARKAAGKVRKAAKLKVDFMAKLRSAAAKAKSKLRRHSKSKKHVLRKLMRKMKKRAARKARKLGRKVVRKLRRARRRVPKAGRKLRKLRRKMKARLALAKKKAAKKRLRKLAKKLRKMKRAAKKATGAAAAKIKATLRKVAAKAKQIKKKVAKLAVKAVGAVTPVSKIRAKQYRQAKAKLQKRAAKLIKKAHKLKTKLTQLQTALSKASTPAERTKIAAKLNKLRAKKAAIKKKAAAVKQTAAKIAAKGAQVVATQQLREKNSAFRKALPGKVSRARRHWMARRQAALRRWLSNNRRKFLARRYGAAKKGGRCPGSPSCRNPAAAAATVAASRAEMAAARADAAINAAKAVAAINRANAAADSAKTAATKAEAAAQVSKVQASAINRAYTYDNARAAKIAAARRWAEKLARMRSKAAAFTRDRIAAAKKLAAFNRKIREKLRRKIMKNTAKSQAIAAKIQARLKKKLLRLKESFQLIAKRLAAKLKEARGEYGTLADVRMKLLAELMQSAQNDLNSLPETLRGPLDAEFRALVKEEAKIFEQLRVSQELELKLTEADSKAKRHEAVAALKAKYQLALLKKADRSAKLRKLYRKVRAKLAKKEKRARKARRRVHHMGLKRQVKAGARLKLSFRAKLARIKMAVKKGRAEMKALRAAFNRKLKRSARRFKAKLRRKRAKLARRARRLHRRNRRGSKKSRKVRKNRKGGKRSKKLNKRKNKKAVKKDRAARKARKTRKARKLRKNRKNRKSRKNRKARKGRKNRKLRRAALRRKLRKLFKRLKLKHKQFRAKQAAQRKAFQKAMRSRERLFRAKLKNQVTQLRNKATALKTQGKTVFKAVVTKSIQRERTARKAFKKARKQLKKLKKLLRRNKVRAKIVRAKVRKVLQLNARAAERRLAQLRAQEVKTGKLRSSENRVKDKIKAQGAKVHKAALVELQKKAASAKLAETLKAKAQLEKQRELSRKRRAALAAKMAEAQKRAKEALIAARRNATRAVEEGEKRVQQHLLQRQAAAAERVQNGGNPIKTPKAVSVFGKGYRAPQFTRFGPLVILGGVVYSKNIRQTLAYLPKKLRPAARHIFDTEVEHALTTRVDVLQSGKVQWHAGSGNVEAGWVSLEGMRFPRKGVVVKPVAPTAPWVNYGKPYAKLGYVKRGGYCSLSGLVRGQNWNTKEWGTQITQLPDACRPRDGRLVFKLNNQDTTHRVDVLPDGRVIWMAGDRRHAWISLDGIGFFVRSSNKLKLGKAWQNYGLSYRPASWKRFDQLCTLSGLVKTTRASRFIARVPKACRPNKKLIFHVNHNGQSWRLDLFPSGQLMWVDGVNSYNWVSLDGISYVVGGWQVYRKTSPLGQLTRKRLRLIKGFKPYGGSYERPTYTRFGGLCLLNGVARSKQLKSSIARLPSVCRPDDRLVFDNHLYNSATVRTDVQPNGLVKWVYGPHNVNRGWLSMNGMLFATKGAWGRALNLTNDWVRFDQRYAKPQVIKRGDLCVVSGLVGLRDRSIAKDPNSKRWPSFIGTLPKNCRPKDGRLVFTVNHHGASLRVDVLPNGQIHYIAGARRHPWISLDGISFVTECASQPIRLAESWRPYGGAYRIPSYKRQSNLCVVSGVVAGGPKKVVGYLPEVCRPRKRQIFFVNHNQYVQRFDVLPNGIILWKNGRRSWPFAILDGIRFAVRPLNYSPDKVRHAAPPKQGPIRTYSGFAPLKNRFADPAFSRQGRICVLNGAVASSNLKGRWGRLPKNCRPKQRLAFTRTVANERNLRLDIEPGGNLEWKAGSGEGGWGSLAGMVFMTSKAVATDIKLLFNWVNYLKGYARASFFKQGDLCVLQGTIRTDNSNLNRWNKNIGQLPKECRPADGDLIFHVNHNEFALRVDITKNGEIIYRAGNKAYPFLSLDGIAFMTESSSRPLKLLSGFWPYTQDGSAFRVPSVKKQGTLCVLSGVANGNGQRAIAQLDEDCRPKGRLIFGTNSDNDALRVDILADGTVYWTGGVRKLPWISLDGIAFTAVGPAANRTALDIPPLLGTPLTLFSGYKPVALGWTSPQFTRVGSICVAYGLARGHNQKGVYGQFPEICRPSARISFANPTFQQSPMRTDVLPNGDMIWAGGDRNGGRINLNAISFPVAGTETAVLPLGSRWVDFGEDFGTARLAQEDQYCVLTGTIRISDNNLGNWNNHLATLPTECRPQNGRISFVVSHGEVNHRVDVRPDGVVEWVSGKKLHPSLALDGIAFFPRDGTPLALEDGYSPYRQGFRIPSFKKQGVLCALSGMVAGVGGKNKHIATLPATCRPTGRLAFSAPHHDNTIQIDVLPDGRVIWSDIAATVGFVSLDGIHFVASGDPEGPLRTPPIPYDLVELTLQNGQEPRAGGFAKPQAAMFDHLCVLNGVMRGSDIKTVYTQLPRNCRPNKRLVLDFHTSSLQTARVDITSNGLVKWVDGATKSDFISLDGVTFATQGSDFKRVAPSVPWVDYGFGYEGASFYVQNGVCTVAGLIRLDGWNMAKWSPQLLILPPQCRPKDGVLTFNVNHGKATHQVDVYPDGRVLWVAGLDRVNAFISLSGITFPVAPPNQLTLADGWSARAEGYRAPAFEVVSNTCFLSGVVKGEGKNREVAVLPAECRPSASLIFFVNHNQHVQRFDVKPTGAVTWVDGPRFKDWVSLDGIRFTVANSEE